MIDAFSPRTKGLKSVPAGIACLFQPVPARAEPELNAAHTSLKNGCQAVISRAAWESSPATDLSTFTRHLPKQRFLLGDNVCLQGGQDTGAGQDPSAPDPTDRAAFI